MKAYRITITLSSLAMIVGVVGLMAESNGFALLLPIGFVGFIAARIAEPTKK